MTHALIHLVQEDTYPKANLWECEAGHSPPSNAVANDNSFVHNTRKAER
jgi:hypothetical protein